MSRFLLDTHVLLWVGGDPGELRATARTVIEDGGNELWVSPVTAWEIAIKHSLGKLELSQPPEDWLPEVMRRSALKASSLSLQAGLAVSALPWHHRDPFDRLLIAHAFAEGLTVITRDEVFAKYGVPVLLA